VLVPGSRIIERGSGEVNGRRTLARAFAVAFVALACAACSRDSRAERALDAARNEVRLGRLEQAVKELDAVASEYAGTEAARAAEKDAILYRGLIEAARLDPLRRARDLLVQTARALERRRAALPETLDAPLDPWGRELVYERTARGYRLASFGADGVPGGEPDLVVENGRFVADPVEGAR
jgi:hypothetical protein